MGTYGAYAGAYAPAVYGAGYAAYSTPYTTYGAAHLIGKREAEADSEAKPWLAYSNYGYAGYPYASTYGAYAYPSVYRALCCSSLHHLWCCSPHRQEIC